MNCSSCGANNRPGARFCQQCGHPLPPPRPAAQSPHQPVPAVAAQPSPRPSTAAPRRIAPVALLAVALTLLLLALATWWLLGFLPNDEDEAPVGAAAAPTTTLPATTPTSLIPGIDLPALPTLGPLPTMGPLVIPGLGIELRRLNDEEEVQMGAEVAAEVEAEYGLYQDAAAAQRVTAIGQAIVPLSDRPQLPYHFRLLDSDEINAFAIPGGFIYVTRGMLEFVANDDELAAVLGHEIAHVGRRHGAQALETATMADAALAAVLDQSTTLADIFESQEGQVAADVAETILFSGWSRQQEFEADEFGALYIARAGYEPQAVLTLMRRMQAQFEAGSGSDVNPAALLLDTHPPFSERIRRVEETLAANNL